MSLFVTHSLIFQVTEVVFRRHRVIIKPSFVFSSGGGASYSPQIGKKIKVSGSQSQGVEKSSQSLQHKDVTGRYHLF